MADLLHNLHHSADFLKKLWRTDQPSLAIILGSGFKSFASAVEVLHEVNISDIPYCMAPSVSGHGTKLIIARHGERTIAVLTGRSHLYEGYSAAQVCYPLRALASAGVSSVILTNASGGLQTSLDAGDLLLIRDQINLTGQTCLDKSAEGLGPRFVDMINCYDADWRARLISKLPQLREGVYLGVIGAAYETPAETAFFGSTGADVIGMSTVQETIAARQMGLRVLGLSFVTNLAGGLSQEVNHDDVIAIGNAKAPLLVRTLQHAVETAPHG